NRAFALAPPRTTAAVVMSPRPRSSFRKSDANEYIIPESSSILEHPPTPAFGLSGAERSQGSCNLLDFGYQFVVPPFRLGHHFFRSPLHEGRVIQSGGEPPCLGFLADQLPGQAISLLVEVHQSLQRDGDFNSRGHIARR